MTAVSTFDELLKLAERKPAVEYHVKAWGGRKVFVRDPSSADVDEWRVYCSRHKDQSVPFSAKLCQIMLCDDQGERIVPQDAEALGALADGDAAAIDEIAAFCLPMVNGATNEEIEEIQKN
jgi:hypothetical protein